jgi:hypothetical protein
MNHLQDRILDSRNEIEELEASFGKPKSLNMNFKMNQKEFANLLESMKTGKNCDVTLFICKDNKIVVIAKPWYKDGLYRAPSGRPRLNPDFAIAKSAQRAATFR